MKTTQMRFNLPVSLMQEEGGQVIAYTPALDISTVGKNEEQAKERFTELVHMFFADLAEQGSTDQVLPELGWVKVAESWRPPVVSNESIAVSVPVVA
jgi:hypothetical protein